MSAETGRLPVIRSLHRPDANPATMSASPDDVTESELQRKLRRAWDLISGNY